MKKLVAVLLTILMLFSLFQGALRENTVKADEIYQWVPINNGLYGEGVESLAIDPTNTNVIYAGTRYGGVFKSTNGGNSWSEINNGLPYRYVSSLVIDPKNTQVVYAGGWGGVFKSTNGGNSWSQSGLINTDVSSLAIDLTNTQVIYTGTTGGVFKSTNGGNSWSEINNGLPPYPDVSSLALDPKNTQVIYAGTYYDGVFKSTNGGDSWSAINNNGLAFTPWVSSLVIDSKNTQIIYEGTLYNRGIFKSTDGGDLWSEINNGLPLNADVPSLAIDPKNTQVIYAGVWGSGVFRSTDGGDSWSEINNGLPPYPYVSSLVIDPQNTQVVYAGGWGGVFKSTNGGNSWSEINNGLPCMYVSSLVIDPQNTQVIYAGTRNGGYSGIFKSTNGGSSWSAITGLPLNTDVLSLAIDPANTNVIYAGTYVGVFKSTDGGDSWSEINNGLPLSTDVYCLAIDPKNTQVIYAGTWVYQETDYCVFKSTDGGDSWSEINNGLPPYPYVAIDPQNTQVVYAGGWGSVFKSTNGGDSWSEINNGLTNTSVSSIAIDPKNTQIIYAGTYGGAFKSTNGGANWTKINNGLRYTGIRSLVIDPKNTQVVYAGGWGGIFKSTDGGDSWSEINEGLINKRVDSLVIDPQNPNILYAGTWGGGVFKYISSAETSCKIELRKNGVKIDKIGVGEGFDIVFTNYSGNIEAVRFLSDETQNGKVDEGFTWTDWYDWNTSKDDWDHVNKIKKWSFTTSGEKEVWAEVKDNTGQTAKCSTNISVSTNWSFAVITDLHIGYNYPAKDVDNDNWPEIDYCGNGWNDSKPTSDEGNYYITGMLTNAINTIIKEREKYNIKFVVILGDISDTAERSEFYKAREILNRLNDPNEDGNTKDGIPYIPLIGNHDTWPYTQDIGKHSINPLDKGSDASDRSHYGDIAFYANGDDIFRKVFWGEENKDNIDLIEKLFGNSWETTSNIEKPISDLLGCAEYRFKIVERGGNYFYDSGIGHKDCVSPIGFYYLQNYGFVYGNITFIALDLAPRLGEDSNPKNGNALPGALKGGIATDHPQTLEFSRDYFKDHQNKKVILFSHYSTSPDGIDKYIVTDRKDSPLEAYWFGGHVHYSKETELANGRYVILTEDVAGIPFSLLGIPAEGIGNGTRDGRTIRIVQIKNGDIDFSTTIEPIYKTHCIITASAGSNGTILPSGKVELNYGTDQTFTITPDTGYHIKDVKVDGVSVGAVSSYTFINVTSNHIIEATFEEEKKETVIILQIGNKEFTVNGISNTLDSPPIIKNGRTLLPIRAVIEALGGTVGWDPNEKKVTVTLGSTTIELWIGKSIAKVNGIDTPIDSTNSKVVPEIINSRTMLPLRFVTENLGCDVQWDGTTKTITITYGG